MRKVLLLLTFLIVSVANAQDDVTENVTDSDEQTEVPDSLIAKADTLNGVVVTAKEIVR